MPLSWSTGGVVGPIIGGFLAHPVEGFPSLFGKNIFLRKYPYFLPCAIAATFSLIAWLITLLFLKETATGPGVLSVSRIFGPRPLKTETLVEQATSRTVEQEQPVALRQLMTRKVLVAASNYATLALVDISRSAIQPVFLATPIELGGLGLPPSRIGNLLSIFGVLNGIIQVFFFAPLHDYLGSKLLFNLGIASALPTFAAFPLLSYLARTQGLTTLVWAVAVAQVFMSIGLSISYGAVFIYISEAAPNRASLGATNGLCQLSVSLMRTIGPAAANSLFSLSIEKGYLGGWMVYYVLMATTLVALCVGAQLPRRP